MFVLGSNESPVLHRGNSQGVFSLVHLSCDTRPFSVVCLTSCLGPRRMFSVHRLGNIIQMRAGHNGLERCFPRDQLHALLLPAVQAETGEPTPAHTYNTGAQSSKTGFPKLWPRTPPPCGGIMGFPLQNVRKYSPSKIIFLFPYFVNVTFKTFGLNKSCLVSTTLKKNSHFNY